MTPLIRPLPKQCEPQTEYRNERLIFAEMKAELRQRKRQQWLQWIKAVLTRRYDTTETDTSTPCNHPPAPRRGRVLRLSGGA